MTAIRGGDSATPKPNEYHMGRIWGVYVAGDTFHVWDHAEVRQLGAYGIEGVMPIVVPPQNEEWWLDNYGYTALESLARQAAEWGVPRGAPLCLDIEEHQFEAMGGHVLTVFDMWARASRQHGFRTWSYGSERCLRNDLFGFKWVAAWPDPTPTDPQIPKDFNAWQYATRPGDGIDLDIFEADRDYMTPDLKVVVLRTPSVKEHVVSAEGRQAPVTAAGAESSDTVAQTAPATSSKEPNEAAVEVDDTAGVDAVHSPALYDPTQSSVPKGGAVTLNSIGHLILGGIAMGGVIALAVLHDLGGSAAVVDVLAIAGVSLGIGAATNS